MSEQVLFYEQPLAWSRVIPDTWYPHPDLQVSVLGHFEHQTANNHWPAKRRKNLVDKDTGSNWTLFKSGVEMSSYRVNIVSRRTAWEHYGYKGPLLAGHSSQTFSEADFLGLVSGASDEPGLAALGTTAIARTLPTNPISDLPTAVGELLTEGLPGLPGRSFRRGGLSRSNISGEYLGYEFGIKPFLSDLQKFREAVLRAEKYVNQYASKSGELIRRKYEFPTLVNETVEERPATTGFERNLGGLSNSELNWETFSGSGGYPGDVRDVRTNTIKRWFSGAFTYYLPPMGDEWSNELFRQEAQMRHLYGGLSVDTAWNLLPYSWAIDWFSNAGDVIHNLAAFARDGLVMPYGYIMEHGEFRSYRTVSGVKVSNALIINGQWESSPILYSLPDVSTTYNVSYKRRRKATPFGFGLVFDDFTDRQKAITAALLLK